MKRVLFLLLIVPCLMSLKLIKDPEFTVNQFPLEMHGDSVVLDMSIKFPPKFFHKKGYVEIRPSIAGTDFGSILFQGQKAEGNARVVPYKQGATFPYKWKIKYKEEMRNSPLLISVTLFLKDEKETYNVDLGKGVITTPKLLHDDEVPLRVGVDKVQWAERSLSSTLYFKKAKHVLKKNELKKESFQKLLRLFDTIEADSTLELIALDLNSHTAPGGEGYMLGGNLCSDRLSFLEDAIDKQINDGESFRKYGVLFSRGEDWNGFRKMVKEEYKPELRDQVLDVFKFYNFEMRTEKLHELTDAYPKVEKDLGLFARGEIILRYKKRLPAGESLLNIALKTPDSLTADLLIAASRVTHSNSKQIKIFKDCIRLYPEDWRGYNNLGATYLMENNLMAAEEFLLAAYRLDTNRVVKYNLAIYSRRMGDFQSALSLYNDMESHDSFDKYFLALLEIQRGNYPEAIELFDHEPCFNHALALTLNKEYNKAVEMIGIDELSIDEAYLFAVILMKQKQYAEGLNLIKVMTEGHHEYKESLRTDYDFHALFGNQDFRAYTQ